MSKTITITTGDKDLRDEVGLLEWDEDTYDCVMDVVNKMLKLKGYGEFSDIEGDTYITIQVQLPEQVEEEEDFLQAVNGFSEDYDEDIDFLKAVNGEV